jgi:ABC-type transport system involved in multi-copper enzyme maturation permease subunit
MFHFSHRLWGKIIFLSAVATILMGLSEYGMTTSFFTPNDTQRSRRLIMNFFALFASLFTLIIIYLLSNPDYQRPPEGTVHNTSAQNM